MSSKYVEFVAEAEEIIDEASASLLEVQDMLPSADPSLINGIFRAMHTLKGMAGLFGFQGLSDISHSLENILDLIRLGKAEMTMEGASFIFGCFDLIRSVVADIRDAKDPDSDALAAKLVEIESFVETIKGGGAGDSDIVFSEQYSAILNVLSEYEEHRLKANIKEGKVIYLLSVTFSLEDFDVLLKDLADKIKLLGELISTMPTSDGVPAGQIGFQLITASDRSAAELQESLACGVVVLMETAAKAAPVAPAVQRDAMMEAEHTLKSSSTSIRVDISKVDSILDTIGDLSLSKQAVFNIWNSFREEYGNTPLVIDLYRVSQAMQRRFSLLQSQVLEIRMVPIGQVFSRLNQVVKRYAVKAGKNIKLEFFGDETEIDKSVAEEVVDPLMHTVRNAIDHGIEPEDERVSAGKSPEGSLEFRAFQRGNNVVISVNDDGRGIDPVRIRDSAVKKGLLSEDDEVDRKEVLSLMFRPGFSTAETVSETSGRGVGLDVVKEKMASLGASIEVNSEPGVGTGFVFTLPITLAIIRALIVRVSTEIFAISLTSMSETFVVEKADIQELDDRFVCDLRGEMLPLVDLRELLQLEPESMDRYFVVVVGHGNRRMGLLLDEFIGQQEVVIKPLGPYFDGLRGFAGASEIGRYKVVLVLDAETIINESLSLTVS